MFADFSHKGIFSYLKKESFPFTVAPGENSINRGRDTPNISNSARWRWWTQWI